MTVRANAVGTLLLALLLGGCQAPPTEAESGRSTFQIPDPDLAGMEPRVEEALQRARAAVVESPGDADRWGELGATYQAHRLIPEAIVCLGRASELAPGEFRWHYLLAIAEEIGGAGPDTLPRSFGAAEALGPEYAPLHVRLGDALSIRGRPAAAREAFARAAELDPGVAAAYLGMGRVSLALGEPERALEFLARAAELAPQDGAVHSALAQVQLRLGRTVEAEQAAERASRLPARGGMADPVFEREVARRGVSSTRAFRRGAARIAQGDPAGAIADLKIVEETRPDDPAVHYWLGVAYRGADRPDLALSHFARAIELREDLVRARFELARLLRGSGRIEEAIVHYRRTVELAPNDVAAHYHLGEAHEALGHTDRAIEQYEAVLRLDPGHDVRERLAGLRVR